MAETVELSRKQALVLAEQAYLAGDLVLANTIGRRLLEADGRDVEALMVMSATEPGLGNPRLGRIAGRSAWQAARSTDRPGALRFAIARRTAKAAFAEGRPLVAQYWLRRSLGFAPDRDAWQKSGEDIQAIRARMPYQISAQFAFAPTSNVNGGSSSGLLIIDDDYVIGTLSGWSQAHAGYQANATLGFKYALSAEGSRRTVVGISGYFSAHWLTADEAAENPTLDASDLDSQTVQAVLERDTLFFGSKMPVTLSVAAGHTWVGQEALGPHLRLEGQLALDDTKERGLVLTSTVERQWQGADDNGTVDALALRLDGYRQLGSDLGSLNFGVGFTAVRASTSNGTYDKADVRVGYRPAAALGPIDLTLAAYGTFKSYPVYSLGFANVTGGRQDTGIGVSIRLGVPSLDVMGFQPQATLSHDVTTSNISRFDSRQTTVRIGLRSSF